MGAVVQVTIVNAVCIRFDLLKWGGIATSGNYVDYAADGIGAIDDAHGTFYDFDSIDLCGGNLT